MAASSNDTMGSDMALPPNMIESRQLESYRRPEPCLLVSRLCCCESAQEIVRYRDAEGSPALEVEIWAADFDYPAVERALGGGPR